MRTKVSILLALFLMTIVIPVLPQTKDQGKEPAKDQPKPVSLAGTWTMTVQMQDRDVPPSDLIITQEKEAIKVTMAGPQGTLAGEGTVKESAVQWTVTISGSQGDFTLVFKGKVDGEKMSGEMLMGEYGTASWAATKKKTDK